MCYIEDSSTVSLNVMSLQGNKECGGSLGQCLGKEGPTACLKSQGIPKTETVQGVAGDGSISCEPPKDTPAHTVWTRWEQLGQRFGWDPDGFDGLVTPGERNLEIARQIGVIRRKAQQARLEKQQ
jgi:hypothetical protein